MKYLAGVMILWLGFFLGAWYGTRDRECSTAQFGGIDVVVCRDAGEATP